MPPRGVKKGTKRARQYEHIKESELDQGALPRTRRGDRGAHQSTRREPVPASPARARGHRQTTFRPAVGVVLRDQKAEGTHV